MWCQTVLAHVLFFWVLAGSTSAEEIIFLGFTDINSRLAVQRAVEGAAERLARPGCQDVLNDFADQSGRPLGTRLAANGTSVADAFRSLRFYDDRQARRCRTGTALAFTHYRSLSADALRVLAGLRENDSAFAQTFDGPNGPCGQHLLPGDQCAVHIREQRRDRFIRLC